MTPRTKSGDVLDVVPRARAAPSARGRRRGADGRCHARARPTRQGARSGLTWEVGPGLEREHGLVLSPGGVRERLVVTDAIVAAAPVGLASWEIHAARPPKRCDRRYQLQRRESWLEVDASAWRYTLVGCNQGEFFDVTLHVGSTLRDASDEERQRAAWLLLDGELGERRTIERIGAVTISDDPVDVARSGAVEHLAEHIRVLSAGGPSR